MYFCKNYLGNCLSPLNEKCDKQSSGIAVSNDSEGANNFFFFCIDSPCSVFFFH